MAAIERWRPRGWLRRWRPLGELARWEEDIEDLFEDFFRSGPAPLWPVRRQFLDTRGWAPTVVRGASAEGQRGQNQKA
jgi:hypothetical protein